MTTSIADVRSSLQSAVETTGLRTYAYIQETINVPCAHVAPLEYDPRLVMGESHVHFEFQVRVFVNRAAAVEQNQKLLDEYRDLTGTKSLILAIQDSDNWATPTTVDYMMVTRVGEVTAIEYNGAPYLMFELDVEVVR